MLACLAHIQREAGTHAAYLHILIAYLSERHSQRNLEHWETGGRIAQWAKVQGSPLTVTLLLRLQ